MQISELFIALGVKGSEKTLTALLNTKLSISSIAATSLEAKAAILGMAYALEKLTVGSATDAANFKNVAAYINSSTTELQKWENAGQRATLQAGAMTKSILGIYNTIKQHATTKVWPAGTAIFAQETGLNIEKPLNFQEVLKRAVQFTHSKKTSPEIVNSILESWGIGSDVLGVIESGQFKLSDVAKSQVLSEKDINNLSRVKSELTENEQKIKLFFGHFTSEHGKETVTIIKDMTTAFLGLATVLDKIATKLHLFEVIDSIFKGWSTVLGWADDKLSGKMNKNNILEVMGQEKDAIDNLEYWQERQKEFQKKRNFSEGLRNFSDGLTDISDFFITSKSNLMSGFGEFKKNIPLLFNRNGYDILKSEPLPQRYSLPSQSQNNIHVTQNLTLNGDPTDYQDMQNIQQNVLTRAIVDTMSQFSSRGRQT